MNWKPWIQILGLVGGIVLPLWNIPLIVRIAKRKSSVDVSLWWAFGVFVCMLIMLPSALITPDPIYKTYSFMNIFLFGALVTQIARFHNK